MATVITVINALEEDDKKEGKENEREVVGVLHGAGHYEDSALRQE